MASIDLRLSPKQEGMTMLLSQVDLNWLRIPSGFFFFFFFGESQVLTLWY